MKNKKTSKNKNLILSIYLYFFMGVGLIMMVIGSYGLGQHYYKSNLLPKYPLGGYEQRCDYLARPMPVMKEMPGEMQEDIQEDEEYDKQVEDCEAQLEEERETRQVTDLYNALITFGIGSLLFISHLFVNLKVSKE